MDPYIREAQRKRRHFRVRKKVAGTAQRPRLVVHRSHLHLYSQLVDDVLGTTLVSVSTRDLNPKGKDRNRGNVEASKRLGELVAQSAKAAGIHTVVFDRGGYRYHGRIKALAEAARAQGLEM